MFKYAAFEYTKPPYNHYHSIFIIKCLITLNRNAVFSVLGHRTRGADLRLGGGVPQPENPP